MELEQASEKTMVHCGKQVDRETVLQQKVLLLQALEFKKPISITASNLTILDTAGIQLLVNFARALTAEKIPWTWETVSPVLEEYAALLGASKLLQLPGELA